MLLETLDGTRRAWLFDFRQENRSTQKHRRLPNIFWNYKLFSSRGLHNGYNTNVQTKNASVINNL